MQQGVRKPLGRRPAHLVFGTQPPTQPFASVVFHGSIGFADWSQTEVVRPAEQHSVELHDDGRGVQQGGIASGLVADGSTDALHSLFGRNGSQVGSPRLRRVAAPERVTQKVERLFWQLADPRLGFIYRELQL